jgi:hypothetical protein
MPEMETHSEPCILRVDRLNDGLVVEFDDGVCALYSAFLLRACLYLAEDVTNVPRPDEE